MSGMTRGMWKGLVSKSCFRHHRLMDRQPCVYILASGYNGTLYVGVTSDLAGRLYQHRTGQGNGFTERYGVYRLVYFEMHEDMPAAIAREKALKKWRREWKRNIIERDNPQWLDLAPSLGLAEALPPHIPSCRT
jgi:putative endonuclease